MSDSNQIILLLLTYVSTGMGLIGYDFTAPAEERKSYVRQMDIKVGLGILFVWPATVLLEVLEEHRQQRQYRRYLLGVLLLAGAMYLCAQVAFSLSLWLININWAAFIITALVMLLANPIITVIVMPVHEPQ